MTISPAPSYTPSTRNPGRPSIASGTPVASAIVRGLLLVAALEKAATMPEAPDPRSAPTRYLLATLGSEEPVTSRRL